MPRQRSDGGGRGGGGYGPAGFDRQSGSAGGADAGGGYRGGYGGGRGGGGGDRGRGRGRGRGGGAAAGGGTTSFNYRGSKNNSCGEGIDEEFKIEVEAALTKFRASWDQQAITFPATLTAYERRFVHFMANQLGLESKSSG